MDLMSRIDGATFEHVVHFDIFKARQLYGRYSGAATADISFTLLSEVITRRARQGLY